MIRFVTVLCCALMMAGTASAEEESVETIFVEGCADGKDTHVAFCQCLHDELDKQEGGIMTYINMSDEALDKDKGFEASAIACAKHVPEE